MVTELRFAQTLIWPPRELRPSSHFWYLIGFSQWEALTGDLTVGWETGWDSLVAQAVKRLPAMRETQVRFLGREDPLAVRPQR